MRLTDLDAGFVGQWEKHSFHHLPSVEGAQGLLFQCPQCGQGKPPAEDGGPGVAGAHYVLCWFVNPRNASKVPDDEFPGPGRWTFTGDTIDTVTLNPSVNLDVHPTHSDSRACKWHGWVQNGEAK